GMANVGSLVAALEDADQGILKPIPKIDADDTDKKFKAAGRRLVGGQAFGCIKCHTFADKRSTGIQALSLTTMTKRLRPEWFHHYMQNPQAYRPGTRMPNVFPDGQTTLPMVLDGSVDKQDRAMWAYLADGDKALLPVGLVTGAIELIAFDEAIMYRNFIEGAGPRAIGVGYPEKLNLAFDANNLRLALIWQGAFIDASRHWEGRGSGFQPPLGDNVIKLIDGVPFAALENDKAPWPAGSGKEQGYRFGGYSLGLKRMPTFAYSFGEIKITDAPVPYGEADVYVLRRTLSLTTEKPIPNLYFRAAAAGKIEEGPGGSYKIDGIWTMKIGSKQKPLVRDNNGKHELLVPVTFEGNAASITQEFEW
ncbi:MAG TPA: cytochrome c1, partial [bacterium]|nr:cytochrome c1 [bacterium]